MTTLYDDMLEDDEHEEFPERRPSRGRTVLVVLAMLAFAAVVLVGAGFLWFQRQANPGDPGEEVELTIPQGASGREIAALLEERGIITDDRLFNLYVRFKGGGPFAAGDYVLRENSSFDDVIATLDSGPIIAYDRLTVQEGLTLGEIAQRVGNLEGRSAEEFLALAKQPAVRSKYQPADVSSLEGLLFPETYQLEKDDDEAAILKRLVTQLDTTADELNIEAQAAARNITPYEAFIVASLIEEETRFDEERPQVARVIYNRLQRGMPLGIDATVIYALGESGTKTRVLYKDLEVNSPYNTYKRKGLPPTPISNFGRASLEAALNPADGDWLYYVVTEKDGRHSFATNAREHAANIRKAEQNGVR